MATYNGWSVDPKTFLSAVGDDDCLVRKGAAGKLLEWFAEQFHQRVEPVVTYNGYRTSAFNKRIGGAARSNHISGTAIDLNGARHPYEQHLPKGTKWTDGFTPAQRKEIRAILGEAGGVIFWGSDFNPGYRDAMHFEIRGTSAAVQKVLEQIEAREEESNTVKRKSSKRTKDQKITKTSSWTTISVRNNGNYSLLGTESDIIDSEVSMRLDGVEAGREVQVRFIKVAKNKNGKMAIAGREIVQEAIGTAGATFAKFTQKTSLKDGERLRVQIKVFNPGVTISSVQVHTDYK